MKNRIIIDFETRSFVDLRKSNSYIYAEDPSTQVMCVAYKFEDDKTRLITTNAFLNHPDRLIETLLYKYAADPNVTFEAHNAMFERNIWTHHMVKKYGFPEIELERWSCSMAKCAYQSLPLSLDQAAKVLRLKNQKDNDGHRLMLKMCKPRKPTKNNPAIWHETPADIKRQEQYCIKDVNAEYELSNKLPELPPYERKVWLIDQRINDRGICCDIESVNKLIRILDDAKENSQKQIQEITKGKIKTANQRDKILEYLKKYGCDLPNLQKKTVSNALDNEDLDPIARKLLETRQGVGKAAVKKLRAIQKLAQSDNRIRGAFFYHGARTGRWASKGLQLHNMVKITYKDIELEVAIDCLDDSIDWIETIFGDINTFASKLVRPMFIAAPGKTLISADFSSIEAKVLLWLAQDKKGLELYRQKKDLYIWMASKIYGVSLGKVTKEQRFVGKQCILGLGYGMGPDRFIKQCKDYGQTVSRSLAEKAVRTYRNTFKTVTKYWRDIEHTVKKTLITRKPQKHHNIVFRMDGKNLYCDLPSGRSLCYQSAHLDEDDRICYWGVNSKTKKWSLLDMWGGKITEHIDQGLSRDALIQAIMRLEKNGFPTVLHVHDEPVCEVELTKANLKEFRKHMNYKESWLKGCPIDVDAGWIGKRYRKG